VETYIDDIPIDPTHCQLDDGRIWSIEDAKFVQSTPAGSYVVRPETGAGRCGLAELDEWLRFQKKPLGELKTDEDFAAEAREKRNALIAETDYLVMPDYPLDEERKAAVLAYRQALRDVPEQAGFPRQIDWPAKP